MVRTIGLLDIEWAYFCFTALNILQNQGGARVQGYNVQENESLHLHNF